MSNRVSRRQANRWAQQDQQQAYQQQQYYQQQAPPPAPAPAAPARDSVDQLKDLAELKEKGVLTDEEFATQKARILA